jgi:hypothetical protein
LLAVKECPVCHRKQVYDARGGEICPSGWIHIAYGGADERVCSTGCMSQLIEYQKLRKKALDVSKETQSLVMLKDVE